MRGEERLWKCRDLEEGTEDSLEEERRPGKEKLGERFRKDDKFPG